MTSDSNHYVEYLREQLASLRDVASKRFFGGVGLVAGETQFAMVMGSELYFVVDDSSRPHYERLGSRCFSYQTKKRRVDVRKYYKVPAELIEDPEQLVALARESIRIASSLKKPPRAKSSKIAKQLKPKKPVSKRPRSKQPKS